jgi:hypothetical protein
MRWSHNTQYSSRNQRQTNRRRICTVQKKKKKKNCCTCSVRVVVGWRKALDLRRQPLTAKISENEPNNKQSTGVLYSELYSTEYSSTRLPAANQPRQPYFSIQPVVPLSLVVTDEYNFVALLTLDAPCLLQYTVPLFYRTYSTYPRPLYFVLEYCSTLWMTLGPLFSLE